MERSMSFNKKIKKDIWLGICVILIFSAGGVFFFQREKSKNRASLARRITELGNGGPPETIEGLKAAITAYEGRIEEHVKLAAQTGVYWKILATRLQDRGLHFEALEALERAIYYNPEDPVLHYLTGVSAGIAAKSLHNFSGSADKEREAYFALAEEGYLKAVALDGRYIRPRYGLAVLYVFELNRPADAVPHLQRYLEISRSDVDAMFILARSYFMTENFKAALDLYDRIIALTRDENRRLEAENNRQIVIGRLYE
jgi:tetratricopeptide (TPR) repeat protein